MENSKLGVIFQGQDTFQFQRIPKILRGHLCIEDGEVVGVREEQKEKLKERAKGQRLRGGQAAEQNCMHALFPRCASL